MAVTHAQDTIWSANVLANLNKALVFGRVCDTEYEGEITGSGSSVKIVSIAAVSGGQYSGTDISIDALTDDDQTLTIDHTPWAGFYLDDVDKAQSKPDLYSAGMVEMAYSIADDIDSTIAALWEDASVEVGDDTPIDLDTAGAAYGALVAIGAKLTRNNVPKSGRWAVVTPEFVANLVLDERFTGAGTSGSALAEGSVGRAAGFDIYESNNIVNDSDVDKCMVGYPGSIAFAGQLNKVEFSRREKGFGGFAKALAVYGVKAIRPSALGVINIDTAVVS